MMKTYKFRITVLLAALMFLACASLATAAGPEKLVSVDWLAKNLKTPNVVVLDVRVFTHYQDGHIPGAVKAFGPWQTTNSKFVGYMMPEPSEVVQMLRSFGVNNDSYVILYDDGVNAQDTALSARALWTLEAMGHNDVAILDGGFSAWKDKGEAVSTDSVNPKAGNFSGKLERSKVATLNEVKEALRKPHIVFLDDRLPEEHFGHEKKSYVKRFGHLPGSRLWPADFMVDTMVAFSPATLRKTADLKKMAEGIGIPANKNTEIITYSTRGIQGALGYYVLHDLLGYRHVKLYDGSILEAASDKSVPMETNSWGFKKRM